MNTENIHPSPAPEQGKVRTALRILEIHYGADRWEKEEGFAKVLDGGWLRWNIGTGNAYIPAGEWREPVAALAQHGEDRT